MQLQVKDLCSNGHNFMHFKCCATVSTKLYKTHKILSICTLKILSYFNTCLRSCRARSRICAHRVTILCYNQHKIVSLSAQIPDLALHEHKYVLKQHNVLNDNKSLTNPEAVSTKNFAATTKPFSKCKTRKMKKSTKTSYCSRL